jgi:hypothetical protein
MARISAPVRAKIEAFDAGDCGPIAGIDVGERYLDLALIEDPRAPALKLARIDLWPISSDVIGNLARAIENAAPRLGRGAIALVDSPRNPRGWNPRPGGAIAAPPGGRAIDADLREIVRAINGKRDRAAQVALSMFPTPTGDYFVRCAADPGFRPHLDAFAREVLGIKAGAPRPGAARRGGGWLFTRFMLSGFATFRALERLGACAFESYPYLAFALHKTADEQLPPKSAGRDAVAQRIRVIARLAHEAGLAEIPPVANLDQADAAVLALTAALGAKGDRLYCVSAPDEGRFLLSVIGQDRAVLDDLIAERRGADSA